jgi:hypothetical protein
VSGFAAAFDFVARGEVSLTRLFSGTDLARALAVGNRPAPFEDVEHGPVRVYRAVSSCTIKMGFAVKSSPEVEDVSRTSDTVSRWEDWR